LRILIVASSSGHLTYHWTRLALGLKRAGHDVTVLSGHSEEAPDLGKELLNAGIEHFKGNNVDANRGVSILQGAKDFERVLKAKEIDIIHAQGATHTFEASIARKILKHSKKPAIVTSIHHIPDKYFVRGYLQKFHWFEIIYSLKFSDFIIPVSENTRQQLIKHGIDPQKTLTVHNGLTYPFLIMFKVCAK
jgi:glycosyltransferase involved in cell wall biosynthesis